MSQINETEIKTPGVYTTEIPSFPPSVAQVETAVPAFIGYTEIATSKGESLIKKAVKIKSLLEYEKIFGKGPEVKITRVDLDINNNIKNVELSQDYYMYDSIRMFYLNGGGKCYVISVGTGYPEGDPKKEDFENAITDVLSKEDEPTLILIPDAVKLIGKGLYEVLNIALKQCSTLQDRFTICDLAPATNGTSWGDTVDEFRNNIDLTTMNYGAAYTPYLKTTLSKNITYRTIKDCLYKLGVKIKLSDLLINGDTKVKKEIGYLENSISDSDNIKNIKDDIYDEYQKKAQKFKTTAANAASDNATVKDEYKSLYTDVYSNLKILNDLTGKLTPQPLAATENVNYVLSSISNIMKSAVLEDVSKLNSYNKEHEKLTGVTNGLYGNSWTSDIWKDVGNNNIMEEANIIFDESIYPKKVFQEADKENAFRENMIAAEPYISQIMKDIYLELMNIKTSAKLIESGLEKTLYDTFSLYHAINQKAALTAAELPASGAIAGIYAQTDAARGVWKAPANVMINGVESLTYTIDNSDNDDLNVSDTGKSINAIRFFTGKGTLVWGARTIDGNSSEWRYIPVRRMYIMVEESIKKATMAFVFEPNTANTWVKVRAMIENYLTVLWRQGALAGAKPEDAFYVKCGLGQTMTAQDIIDGKLIVEIGMAPARPAEFIILRFSQTLQVS